MNPGLQLKAVMVKILFLKVVFLYVYDICFKVSFYSLVCSKNGQLQTRFFHFRFCVLNGFIDKTHFMSQ